MAKFKRFTSRYKQENDTGFGNQTNNQGSRLLNTDGTFNIKHHGMPFFQRFNIFHELITLPWWKFNLIVFIAYLAMNLFFAALYLLVGMDEIDGDRGVTSVEQFWDAFFFSAQTLTTVGYGRENPIGLHANFVSAFGCLIGLMSFALMTGLLYSRFSRPVVRLVKSDNIIIAPYQSGKGLMFRIANKGKNQLIECEVQLLMAMNILEGESVYRRFFPLTLERDKITTLALSWTIVHPITDTSPLHEISIQDLIDGEAEFLFMFKSFDDTYAQQVHTRFSYQATHLIEGVKFEPMYERAQQGNHTILRLDRINEFKQL